MNPFWWNKEKTLCVNFTYLRAVSFGPDVWNGVDRFWVDGKALATGDEAEECWEAFKQWAESR